MALLYILTVVFTVAQSVTTKFYTKSYSNPYFYNALKAFFATILMLLLNGLQVQFEITTFILASIYGICLCISMYSGYMALKTGPMSLSSMLVSFSIIIPILYGLIFCGESLTIHKIIGICFSKLPKSILVKKQR